MIPTIRFARTVVLSALASVVLALWLMGIAVPRAQSAPAGTIQDLINAASDGGTVSVPDGMHTESLTITKNLTLTGVLSSTTIIQAEPGRQVITVANGYNLRIENLTVTGGQAAVNGGGIFVENGNLTIVNSRITNNSAQYGAGIYEGSAWYPNESGILKRVEIIGSILELNHTDKDGGAVYASGDLALVNTQVLSNTAGRDGGGVEIWSGRGDLNGGVFQNNTAAQHGGGVNVNNSISVTGTQFITNTAGGIGGGLQQWNTPPTVSIVGARFERNTSSEMGGGMRANAATTISGTLFLSNTVFGTNFFIYGGGAHISNTLQVSSSSFAGNTVSCDSCYTKGGGLSIGGPGTFALIEDSTFEKNYAWEGAGVYRDPNAAGTVTVRRSTFRDNTGGYGGGINAPDMQVENSDFLRNSVRDRGGAIQADTAVLTATRFISNAVGMGRAGGGIAILGNRLDGTNLLFLENQGLDESAAADVFYNGFGSANLRHVTVAHPTMSSASAIVVPVGTVNITNSIILSHTVGISQTGGTVNVDYTLFFGGTGIHSSGGTLITGTHILSGQDPRLVNPTAGDYHLLSNSPAVDYGTDLGVTTDLDGHSRPVGAKPDLGSYEYVPPPPPPPTPPPPPPPPPPPAQPKMYLPLLRK